MRGAVATALAVSLLVLAGGVPLAAQAKPGDDFPVPRLAAPPLLDGVLDDSVWRQAARLDRWVQVRPGDNREPEGRTIAYLGFDRDNLYIGVRAWDDRSKMRYRLHERDAITDQGQDYIGFFIDTFNDRRRAFAFAVNPLGVQGDGIRVETGTGGSQSTTDTRAAGGFVDWDAAFHSAGKILPDGWSVEIAVPFKTLRYAPGQSHRWGFDMRRSYGRANLEDSPWPKSRDLACDLCQMITLTGIDDIHIGHGFEVNPALIGRVSARRNPGIARFDAAETELDFGGNLKYGLTPSLTLDATINPDFPQIEADAGQLELNNRFALFFPEKRPFFLEGGDIFQTRILLPGHPALAEAGPGARQWTSRPGPLRFL